MDEFRAEVPSKHKSVEMSMAVQSFPLEKGVARSRIVLEASVK